MTNRTTGEEAMMALFDNNTKIAQIRFDYDEHCFHLNDTYNIMDELMDELASRGCIAIRILEVNRPNGRDAEYEVAFAIWYNQKPVDYGFGAGQQYPMPCSLVRRQQVA